MPIELTREELFKKVWAAPMTKVAAEYGISDVALKKICTKNRIPVPGRGYWAKLAAGKPVKQARYRAISDPALNRIWIYGSTARRLPAVVQEAQRAAKANRKESENFVVVPATPDALHPLVERTAKSLARAKPSEKGLVSATASNQFRVDVAPDNINRAIGFINAFVAAAEDRGYKIRKSDKSLAFIVDDEAMELRIEEQVTRSKHTPTEEETAALERWHEKQRRQRHGWQHTAWTPPPTPPDWDYAPTGLLKVVINEELRYGYEGLRHVFADGKTQRIEDLATLVLDSLPVWSVAIKDKRVEDERRRLEWEERARQHEEQRRTKALENKRIESLTRSIDRWRKHKQVLAYISAVEAKLESVPCEDPDAAREWIDWARGYAERIDPLAAGLPKLLQGENFREWELG